jgi:hypothetical protein
MVPGRTLAGSTSRPKSSAGFGKTDTRHLPAELLDTAGGHLFEFKPWPTPPL